MENYKITDEDIKRIASVLLSMGTNINELPKTTDTTGAISLPAVLDGKLVAVDLQQLLAALKAATTEAQSATSAALKAKTDTVAATAEASNAAEGANAVISEHATVAVKALLGASAFFDDIIEDATIQPANPTNETGGLVVYVKAKKQFAFKLLQGAITTYFANWSNDTLYHEHESYAIAKNKIYVHATGLYVWNNELQDLKKVSTEAVVQLVQTITDDAEKAPSAAAVNNAITSINQEVSKKVSKDQIARINGQPIVNGGNNIEIEGGGTSDITHNIIETNGVTGKVFFDKEISSDGTMLAKKNVNCTDFIEIKQKHRLKITSAAGIVKVAFYDLARKFLETLEVPGAISNYELKSPGNAKFLRANLLRNNYMQGIDKIVDIDNNVEGVLPSVKNFLTLKPIRNEAGYIMSDGTIKQYQGIKAISVYDATDIKEIFVNGTVSLAANCAFFWMKNAEGKILEVISRNFNSETFSNTKIVLPAGTKEIWAFLNLKISKAVTQSEINDEIFKDIEAINNNNETLQQKISDTQKDFANLDNRVKGIEAATPSNPEPTPTPEISLNFWKGKKILWIGASAPKGQTLETNPDFVSGSFLKKPYPILLGELLQCKVVNASIGGLGVEAVWNGAQWIARGGGSISLSFAEYNNSKKGYYSYEGILQGNEDADLIIFDIEPNNTHTEDITHLFNFADWTWERVEGEDPAEYDEKWKNWDQKKGEIKDFAAHRDSYQGALIYVIDKIYEKIPNARICFVSEAEFFSHEKWDTEQPATTATKQLAKKMHVVDIDLLAKSNFVGKNKDILYNSDGHPKNELHKIYAKILAHELLRIA